MRKGEGEGQKPEGRRGSERGRKEPSKGATKNGCKPRKTAAQGAIMVAKRPSRNMVRMTVSHVTKSKIKKTSQLLVRTISGWGGRGL